MIIKGNPRRDVAFWAGHLMRLDHNERVTLAEIRGLSGQTVKECLWELDAIAGGTNTKNGFYVASLNPRDDEILTGEQWEWAADRLEEELGLSGQARFVVEHEKEGRTHRHVVWSRIDPETMKAIPADFNFQKHEQAARAIEEELGLAQLESVLVKDRDSERRERRTKDWEGFRAADTKIDPAVLRAEITALWQEADSGFAFKAALEDAGFILARGDRRDFCVIDPAAHEHSLARCVDGVKTKEIRARMAEIDRDSCPSVSEARKVARDAAAGGGANPQPEPQYDPSEAFWEVAPERRASELEPIPERQATEFEDVDERRREDFTAAPDVDADSGERPRVTPWGRLWRAVSDFAALATEQLNQYIHDENSGTPDEERGPWVRFIGAGRKILGGYFQRDGERLADGLEEAKALAIQEALRRLDAATPPADAQAHHPPDEHHREPPRPGAFVDAPEPDDRPQSEQETPLEALDIDAFAWMADDYEGSEWGTQTDDQPEPEAPEPEGWDIEP